MKKPTVSYIAFIPATAAAAALYFVNGKFFACSRNTATQYATLDAVYDALREAYKNYRISGAELDSYITAAEKYRAPMGENELAAHPYFVSRVNR